MAYNVIKGNIEFSGDGQGKIEDMVDDHSDQTIAGIKTFSGIVTASSGLSASFFYGDGTNLTGITEPAIVTYDGAATNRVIVGSYNNNVVSGAAGLSYDGSSLSVTGDVTASVNVSASAFQGDGNALLNIGATSLNLGQGIENDGSNNIRIKLDTAPGIARGSGGIKVDLSGLTTMTSGDLQTSDTMLVSDGGVNKSITMANLTTYFDNTIADTSPAGSNRQLQFNDDGDFGASANLTFNSSTNLLTTVSGNFQTIEIEGQAGQNTILTLDKGENSASYVEFRNDGTKYAEIFGSSAENLKIRTTTAPSTFILGHYTEDVITLDTNNTTFDSNKVIINQDLTITGSTTTASRLLNVSASSVDCTLDLTNEILMMTNTSPATASLPSVDASSVGLTYTIKRTQSGEVEVSGSGTQTIDNSGQTRTLSAAGQYIKLVATEVGANYGWAIIGKSGSF
jgi:hypothetical protein